MKKLFAMIMSLMLAACLWGCDQPAEDSLALMAPDGAPALAIASILDKGTVGGIKVDATVVAGTEIAVKVSSGEADAAVMPLNLAAKVYNGGAKIKLVSVNAFGNLYIVGKDEAEGFGLENLKGKVVCATGRGGTPEFTLKYLLDQSDIECVESESEVEGKVAIRYFNEASEIIPLIKAGKAAYAVLGEPAVTQCNNVTGTVSLIDIQKVWKDVTGDDYTQAGFVVSEKVYGDTKLMKALTTALSENADWCKANADGLLALLQESGSALQVNFDEGVLERCNIGYMSASAAKKSVESYLNILLGFNAQVVGGKLPDKDFYYGYSELAPSSPSDEG